MTFTAVGKVSSTHLVMAAACVLGHLEPLFRLLGIKYSLWQVSLLLPSLLLGGA